MIERSRRRRQFWPVFPLLGSLAFSYLPCRKGTLKSSQASFQGPPNDELDVIATGRHFQFGFYCSLVTPLALPSVFRYLTPAVAKTSVVTFRSHNGDRPSKFIVVAANRKQAINMAWEHGGADFQSRFDKSTGQAQEMKEGAFIDWLGSISSWSNRESLW